MWALSAVIAGCAIRLEGGEHYFGPVLFRFSDPDRASARVSQVVRVGVFGDVGSQWGIGLGYGERLAVAPMAIEGSEAGQSPSPSWIRPLSLRRAPEPGQWNLSLFYLKVTAAPPAFFVRRSLVGIEATAGADAVALSVGATFRTVSRLPRNALMWLQFTADQPLRTTLRIWAGPVDAELPADFIPTEDEHR